MKPLIVLAALTATAGAYSPPKALRFNLFLHEKRQAANGTATAAPNPCATALASFAFATGVPTPSDSAVDSFLATAAVALGAPSAGPLDVPPSLTSAFCSYESQVSIYAASNTAIVSSLLSACPPLTSIINNPLCAVSANPCATALASFALASGVPTPSNAPLEQYLATAALALGAPGAGPLTIPTSLSSAFCEYESQVGVFAAANTALVSSLLAACPPLTSVIANPLCAATTATVVASSSTSKPSAVATAGASRETGLVAAALAAAGFIGAVAVAL